jgi:hypothetical protein
MTITELPIAHADIMQKALVASLRLVMAGAGGKGQRAMEQSEDLRAIIEASNPLLQSLKASVLNNDFATYEEWHRLYCLCVRGTAIVEATK